MPQCGRHVQCMNVHTYCLYVCIVHIRIFYLWMTLYIHMILYVHRFVVLWIYSWVHIHKYVCMIVSSDCVLSHEITPYACTSMDVNGMAMQVSLLQCCCGPGLLQHPERQAAPPGRAGSAWIGNSAHWMVEGGREEGRGGRETRWKESSVDRNRAS